MRFVVYFVISGNIRKKLICSLILEEAKMHSARVRTRTHPRISRTVLREGAAK